MVDLNLPDRYNASTTFIDANLEAGRSNKAAILYGEQTLTYKDVASMVNKTGNALLKIGVQMEQRVLLLLLDSPEFVYSFFGAIRLGDLEVGTTRPLTRAERERTLREGKASRPD